MPAIRTCAAAAMIGVSPNTLRSWERRYGYPQPLRTPGGHRQYALAEIESLRLALAETHNVSSAISLARDRGDGPASPSRLAGAIAAFEEERCARVLEESLALRNLERTIEEVLLPAVAIHEDPEQPTAEHDFGWRFATAWLSAQRRLAPPAHGSGGILGLDATAHGDLDALYAQALELILRRAGVRMLALSPVIEPARAVRALDPLAVVLAGRRVALDAVGRLVYAVRAVAGEVAVFDYRGAFPDTGASTVRRLGPHLTAARDTLLAHLDAARPSPAAAAGPARVALRMAEARER